MKIHMDHDILSENDRVATQIRERLSAHRIVTLNLMSSPGSGKTSLLEKTLAALKDDLPMALVAGDVHTENDAARLVRAGGVIVRPLVTGGACHLEAGMISPVLEDMDLSAVRLLFIENIGNLICPAAYDLGETMKVVLISTAEGEDKPLKYPAMFRNASVMVLNKIDLLAAFQLDLDRLKQNALGINPNLRIFEISCRSGQGLQAWFSWLRELVVEEPAPAK